MPPTLPEMTRHTLVRADCACPKRRPDTRIYRAACVLWKLCPGCGEEIKPV
jgi:hypothetical protein